MSFEHNLSGAQAIAQTTDDPGEQEYWAGYQRGVRRRHHGEAFGTEAEHLQWNALDDSRGQGYRDGHTGVSIADALQRAEA